MCRAFLPYDLDQHPLPPPPVKFAVEDPLPRAKIEAAIGHRHDYLAPHDLAFHMSVSVVLTGVIVPVLTDGGMRRQFLKPLFIVLMQAVLIVVDEHAGSDVQGIVQAQPLLDATLVQALLNFPDPCAPTTR